MEIVLIIVVVCDCPYNCGRVCVRQVMRYYVDVCLGKSSILLMHEVLHYEESFAVVCLAFVYTVTVGKAE